MSTSCYLKRGSSYIPTNEAELNIQLALPLGKFIIKVNPQTEELYFEELTSDYESTGQLYGKTAQHATRIMLTFKDRPNSTGVALVGEKGSGKTMLARLLSELCAGQGIPTIIINEPFVGEKFNKIIQDLKQPVMILFDEFEKTYDKEKQEQVLTLLDGVFPSKKLFVITSNDASRIDAHMRNRPGRIFYMIDHKGVDEAQIRGYCGTHLNNKVHIDEIVKISQLFNSFNFDMMKAMVEEMNRYNEDPHEVMELLNARPQTDQSGTYEGVLRLDGKVVTSIWPGKIEGNPLAVAVIKIGYHLDDDQFSKEFLDQDDGEQKFHQADIQNIDLKNGVFTYVNDKGAVLTYSRVNGKVGDFRSLFSKIPLA